MSIIDSYANVQYLLAADARLFTLVLLPQEGGAFPTVVIRTPYVQADCEAADAALEHKYRKAYAAFLERGYAVVFQHCRGQGKSTGEFVPYVCEREDGLSLLQWIRTQGFYNGELFLCGASYSSSLHYCTAPFAADIKGAVFEIQDSERYRLWYRNGQMRKGHANWHFSLYKRHLPKHFSMSSFSRLPLAGLSEQALSERAEDFEQMLFAPNPTDRFWDTRLGGAEARNATDAAAMPILLTTGYNDFYVGGVFRMWHRMNPALRRKCALLVSPYNHGDTYSESNGLAFPQGARREQFGAAYAVDWFDHIRKNTPLPYKTGEITYYRTFEGGWQSDFYARPTRPLSLTLGEKARSFCYHPLHPPAFPAEGNRLPWQEREDVITLTTKPLERDVFIKGQITATLSVRSDRPDTSFYIALSIRKPQGDYLLRHDITSLGYQLQEYRIGQEVTLRFCFDEHAFLLKKGECLRIDIAGTDDNTYVCHTNQAGPYASRTQAAVATNTVELSRSILTLPVEE